MVTNITVPKEKAKPAGGMDIRDEHEYLVRCRAVMDQTQAFIEDPNIDEMINWGRGSGVVPKLPPERIEELAKAGIGTSGIFTVVEPADLDLYRSYMHEPLSMPDKPEVGVIMVDYNHTGNPLTRYQEGFVMPKAKRPDGKEAWLVVSMPVPNLLMCWMGVAWGLPKYVCDEMTVTPTKAEAIYEGEVRLSLELTPDSSVDEAALKERGTFGQGNCLTFHPVEGGTCLINWFGRGGEPIKPVEWQAGMVKVYIRPQDRWAGLIPANSVTPGVFQRNIGGGGGDFVWQKVKG